MPDFSYDVAFALRKKERKACRSNVPLLKVFIYSLYIIKEVVSDIDTVSKNNFDH